MKTLKSLLLGSAGAAVLLAASTVAQAADAPKAVSKGKEPVYRCDTPGFIEYPGSDVCFKIGGSVQAWASWAEDQFVPGVFVPWAAVTGTHTVADTLNFQTQGVINIDVRQATEYGIVRTFIELEAQDNDTNTGGPANLTHAFIQIGNVLVGKTWSSFFAGGMWPEYFGIGNHFVPLGVPLVRINQIRYTASLGNGVTMSIGLEDPNRLDGGFNGTIFGIAASRNEVPDVVANINVAQSWGRAQLSVAAHQESFISGGVSNRPWVWAVNLAAVINVPSMGRDTLHIQVGYTEGFQNAFSTHGATFTSFAAGAVFQRTDSLVIVGGYRHYWNDQLRSAIGVSWWDHDYPALFVLPTDTANVLMIWGNLIWTPVPTLDLGVEVMYGEREQVNGVTHDGFGGTVQAVKSF